MKTALVLSSFLLAGSAAHADLVPRKIAVLTVPSGQPVAFFESLLDRPGTGLTARFRFVAPELPQKLAELSYAQLEADMSYLCDTYALPRIATPVPSIIVISLAQRETVFGSVEPDVAQIFEAYRPAGETCEWEAF